MIQSLEDIIWKWAFLEVDHVALHVVDRASSDNNSISVLTLELRVVVHPAKRTLCLGQAMFLRDRTKQVEGIEIFVASSSVSLQRWCGHVR